MNEKLKLMDFVKLPDGNPAIYVGNNTFKVPVRDEILEETPEYVVIKQYKPKIITGVADYEKLFPAFSNIEFEEDDDD